jgi:PadR family transcriptional regulator PadR
VRSQKNDNLQGTLALFILKTISAQGRMHGYAITSHIQRVLADLLRVEEGSRYPALHRMTHDGWLHAEWGTSEKNRDARFYTIIAAGRTQLAREEQSPLARRRATCAAARLNQAHRRFSPCHGSHGSAMSFGRTKVSNETDSEMTFHLAERTDDLVRIAVDELLRSHSAPRRAVKGPGSNGEYQWWALA